jgi:translation initiation factor IF-2
VRVYEYSKKCGLSNKELISLLNDHGFEAPSHMSVLSDEAIAFLEKRFMQAPKKTSPEVPSKKAEAAMITQEKISEKTAAVPEGFAVKAMTVSEFAEKTKKPLVDVILSLLKKGIVASKNQVISEEVVQELALQYEIKIAEHVSVTAKEGQGRFESVAGAHSEERLPVVVVIGHVDHGKTTLLDFVRKTRVAAREKGGITQHLGAYEAQTKHGSIVFLDTPGHEAFSRMRVRGIKAADIAILVVAADDGVMPQTIEAIKAAQAINLPIIVAINKVDKVSPAQVEKVKHSLSQYGLVPEEWGGQTVVMPISAKLGTGVDELLEVVTLQAQLMELAANPQVAAQGFVLESKLEKGLGLVATIICQQGTLHVGDYFVAGSITGKVTALINSVGKRVKEVRPSVPVLVAGFDQLPQAGDPFEVVSQEEYKKYRQNQVAPGRVRGAAVSSENALNLIIKTDNVSSLEAVLGAIGKFSGKAFKEFNVLHGAIGAITESDIDFAIGTKALVYGLHVKVEPNAALLAQKNGVIVKLFDIIYKMLEDLEVVAEQGRPAKIVTKKIGEAVVLKVFDIKSLGVVAGAQIKSGLCSRNGKMVIWRGKYKVGEGSIKSLQRDKKSVKEVHAGFECAFMVDGFTDWQVDDRVECFLETSEKE